MHRAHFDYFTLSKTLQHSTWDIGRILVSENEYFLLKLEQLFYRPYFKTTGISFPGATDSLNHPMDPGVP